MSPQARQGFRLNGWHVLAMLVAFFGVTIAVDAVMIVDSYRTYPGEVSSQPYEDGLAWDSELDQQHAQAALGWRVTAGFAGPDAIELTVRDRLGEPLPLAQIEARLERPATETGRLQVKFRPAAAGVYRAEVGRLAGVWDLRVSVYDAKGRRFVAERRLTAPEPGR
ncbi:MAG TPA: FixH family protein [Caulobacteraceae bacterium]|jgi:nitrogen fixation protein FixH|nr:FixH family protein [Caulobacteraceae bacterium]